MFRKWIINYVLKPIIKWINDGVPDLAQFPKWWWNGWGEVEAQLTPTLLACVVPPLKPNTKFVSMWGFEEEAQLTPTLLACVVPPLKPDTKFVSIWGFEEEAQLTPCPVACVVPPLKPNTKFVSMWGFEVEAQLTPTPVACVVPPLKPLSPCKLRYCLTAVPATV